MVYIKFEMFKGNNYSLYLRLGIWKIGMFIRGFILNNRVYFDCFYD